MWPGVVVQTRHTQLRKYQVKWRFLPLTTTLYCCLSGLVYNTGSVCGQPNARRDAAFAVSAIDREHGHFLERFIPPNSGIVVEPVYYGELFNNTRGGISTRRATQYEGLLDLAIAADFKKLGLRLPGRFVILGQNSHGRGLTTDFVGDAQIFSNIDSFFNVTQVGEYWWEIPFCYGAITIRLGKQDVNTEFLVVERATDFIQSGFGLSPALAVPTYPDNSAALLVMADLTDSLNLKVGVWDGVPNGRNWGISDTGITFTIGEVQYDYALCDGQFAGAIELGIGYLSAGTVQGETQSQSWGYYIEWEQTVFREKPDEEDDDQGVGVFLQYGANHGQIEVDFPEYFGAGVVYRGLISSRDADTVGVGLARARLNSGGTNRETVVEVFYKAQLRPNLYVQPDLQYIASPGGIHPDALVVGTRFEVAF